MQRVEGGVMRLAAESPNKQPFTAVSKQGHVDVARNAPFPRRTEESAAACRAAERPAARG